VGDCITKFEESAKYFSDIMANSVLDSLEFLCRSFLNNFKLFRNQAAEIIVQTLGFRSLPQRIHNICIKKITGNVVYANKHCLFWKPNFSDLFWLWNVLRNTKTRGTFHPFL